MKELVISAYQLLANSQFIDVTFFDDSLKTPKTVTRKNLLLSESFFGEVTDITAASSLDARYADLLLVKRGVVAMPRQPQAKDILIIRLEKLQKILAETQEALSGLGKEAEYYADLKTIVAYAEQSITLRENELKIIEGLPASTTLSEIASRSSQILISSRLALEKLNGLAEELEAEVPTPPTVISAASLPNNNKESHSSSPDIIQLTPRQKDYPDPFAGRFGAGSDAATRNTPIRRVVGFNPPQPSAFAIPTSTQFPAPAPATPPPITLTESAEETDCRTRLLNPEEQKAAREEDTPSPQPSAARSSNSNGRGCCTIL